MTTFKQLGVGLAVAILLDATVVRAVLLPSVLTLLGDRTWWLPALAVVPAGALTGQGIRWVRTLEATRGQEPGRRAMSCSSWLSRPLLQLQHTDRRLIAMRRTTPRRPAIGARSRILSIVELSRRQWLLDD